MHIVMVEHCGFIWYVMMEYSNGDIDVMCNIPEARWRLEDKHVAFAWISFDLNTIYSITDINISPICVVQICVTIVWAAVHGAQGRHT